MATSTQGSTRADALGQLQVAEFSLGAEGSFAALHQGCEAVEQLVAPILPPDSTHTAGDSRGVAQSAAMPAELAESAFWSSCAACMQAFFRCRFACAPRARFSSRSLADVRSLVCVLLNMLLN